MHRSNLVLAISALLFLLGTLSTIFYFSGREPVEQSSPLPTPQEVTQGIQLKLESLDYSLPALPLAFLHRGRLTLGLIDFNGKYRTLASLPAGVVVPLSVDRPCCNRQHFIIPLRFPQNGKKQQRAEGIRFVLISLPQRRALLSPPLREIDSQKIKLLAPYPEGILLHTRRGWLRWSEGMERWEQLSLPSEARPLYWGDRLTVVSRERVIYPPSPKGMARKLELPPQSWMVLTTRRGVVFADRSARLLGMLEIKKLTGRLPIRPGMRNRVRLVPTADGRLGAIIVGLRVFLFVDDKPSGRFFLPSTFPFTVPADRLWTVKSGLLLVRRRQIDLINPLGERGTEFHLPVGANEIILP